MKDHSTLIEKKEQELFEKLSEKNEKLLLVHSNETDEDGVKYIEYYFTYKDPSAENFGLETFYAKVKKADKKQELISEAISRTTEKMVKQYIKKTTDYQFKQSETYEGKSQVDYGLFVNNNFKGSFCCVLKHKVTNEYVIVTSKHNCLDKGTYDLKSKENSFTLSFVKKSGDKDYALLGIVPNQDFLDKLLHYKMSAEEREKVTAYNQPRVSYENAQSGNSGGNLHQVVDEQSYIWGLYNGNKKDDVSLDIILSENKEYQYVG